MALEEFRDYVRTRMVAEVAARTRVGVDDAVQALALTYKVVPTAFLYKSSEELQAMAKTAADWALAGCPPEQRPAWYEEKTR